MFKRPKIKHFEKTKKMNINRRFYLEDVGGTTGNSQSEIVTFAISLTKI